MTERPILFSGPMVRAILAGRKTETRRVVDLRLRRAVGTPHVPEGCVLQFWYPGAKLRSGYMPDDARSSWQVERLCGPACEPSPKGIYPPTGHVDWRGPVDGWPGPYDGRHPVSWGTLPFWPGLRLWVKETWQESDSGPDLYAADYDSKEHAGVERWRPSIYMKRASSRITLEVTGVRVEPLQAITEDAALAEGMQKSRGGMWCGAPHDAHGFPRQFNTAVEAFHDLWDAINGKRAPWDSNPWVWIVTFKRLPPG